MILVDFLLYRYMWILYLNSVIQHTYIYTQTTHKFTIYGYIYENSFHYLYLFLPLYHTDMKKKFKNQKQKSTESYLGFGNQ